MALWPLSQVLWSVSVLRSARVACAVELGALWPALDWYRKGGALLDNRPLGRRYYDDNAWIGLVAAQEALFTGEPRWWDRAMESARFLRSGCRPDGGILWVEGGSTRNACSTGSAGLLFTTIAHSHPHLDDQTRADLQQLARAASRFLHEHLLRDDGLIADHIGPRAGTAHDDSREQVEPSVWSYNQALAVALFDRTGFGNWAEELVAAVSGRLAITDLHSQPAAFVAIWYRTMLARAAAKAADPAISRASTVDLDAYLDHWWRNGRDSWGMLREGPRYDDGVVIDHAALTGLMAARSAAPSVQAHLL